MRVAVMACNFERVWSATPNPKRCLPSKALSVEPSKSESNAALSCSSVYRGKLVDPAFIGGGASVVENITVVVEAGDAADRREIDEGEEKLTPNERKERKPISNSRESIVSST